MSGLLRGTWEFVVGDDWRMAAGVVAAFALSGGLVSAGIVAWWALPLAVALVLAGSLVAATRAERSG